MSNDNKRDDDNLTQQVEQRVKRLIRAQKEKPTVLGQSLYMGTLGLLLVLPVVGGAYLGRWIDGMVAGYSVRWTLSCLFLGLVIGVVNVYLLVKE
ncbi:putative F0F1-ATPase subunit [Geobacter sp. OR-1]|uniref:AtpZ/AtpI family protein n=1 Tax=Geobacter sp. OR-1 TaxID=1266765 RepID=UPI0005419CF0|nr:AtpZ/AtpI family protein [Geobacter sp. OR-1]GAM08318.1 putative F0F1-ATPase subunit [Geobacter sp. OR-1]